MEVDSHFVGFTLFLVFAGIDDIVGLGWLASQKIFPKLKLSTVVATCGSVEALSGAKRCKLLLFFTNSILKIFGVA